MAITAALVRMVAKAITTDVISDADILLVAAAYATPIIEGALKDFGAPWPTDWPDQANLIGAYLTASHIVNDRFYQVGEDGKFSRQLWQKAWEMIDKIKKGELELTGSTEVSDGYRPISVEDPTLDRPATEVFVGSPDGGATPSELYWEDRDESRES